MKRMCIGLALAVLVLGAAPVVHAKTTPAKAPTHITGISVPASVPVAASLHAAPITPVIMHAVLRSAAPIARHVQVVDQYIDSARLCGQVNSDFALTATQPDLIMYVGLVGGDDLIYDSGGARLDSRTTYVDYNTAGKAPVQRE